MLDKKKKEKQKKINPSNFSLETTSIWDFPKRGKWATHNPYYRGNWSPYIPRNLILRYSKKNNVILDQFLGSGTTLIECKLLNRKGIGVDINPKALKLSKKNLNFNNITNPDITLRLGDARKLNFINNNSIDLICTHPPYANIIKYSKNIIGDLSLFEDINIFLKQIEKVAKESFRILKNNKYCAILIGDIRQKKHILPLGFKVMNIFIKNGFVLKEIIIKKQNNCKTTPYWRKKSVNYNFYLISHEYLFIFRKPFHSK